MSKAVKPLRKLSPSHQLMKDTKMADYSVAHSAIAEPEEGPKADPVKPMPIGDDEEVRRARRRSLASQQRRSGRASTVLSQGETLG